MRYVTLGDNAPGALEKRLDRARTWADFDPHAAGGAAMRQA